MLSHIIRRGQGGRPEDDVTREKLAIKALRPSALLAESRVSLLDCFVASLLAMTEAAGALD
jgi:hypothetical protein